MAKREAENLIWKVNWLLDKLAAGSPSAKEVDRISLRKYIDGKSA